MQFPTLATDFDGTLADRGAVAPATLQALDRFRSAGGRLILVTGRILAELRSVFDRLDLFERVVAEDGAVVFDPATGKLKRLASPPSPALLDALQARGVGPIAVGHVVLASWVPHEAAIQEAIDALGLDLVITRNKRALMVLPRGVNKAAGLKAALGELGIAPEHVAGVGDAENDVAFLQLCGLSAAVANALPAVAERVNIQLRGNHGAGVVELVDALLGGRFDPT